MASIISMAHRPAIKRPPGKDLASDKPLSRLSRELAYLSVNAGEINKSYNDVVGECRWYMFLNINCASYAWSFTVDSCWFYFRCFFGCSFGFKGFIGQPLHGEDLTGFQGPPILVTHKSSCINKAGSIIKFYYSGRNGMKQETLIIDQKSSYQCSGGVLSLFLNAAQSNGQRSLHVNIRYSCAFSQPPGCNSLSPHRAECHALLLSWLPRHVGSNGFKLLQQMAKGWTTDRAFHMIFVGLTKMACFEIKKTTQLLATWKSPNNTRETGDISPSSPGSGDIQKNTGGILQESWRFRWDCLNIFEELLRHVHPFFAGIGAKNRFNATGSNAPKNQEHLFGTMSGCT